MYTQSCVGSGIGIEVDESIAQQMNEVYEYQDDGNIEQNIFHPGVRQTPISAP
jgi:hypothetical protein